MRRSRASTVLNGPAGSGRSAGEVLDHDPSGGAVQAAVGDLVEPLGVLQVQVVQVAEAARQEEVLAHVAERPLDLSLGFCPVGSAGPGHGPVMGSEVEQLVVVDDATLVDLAEHGRFHPVVKDLLRHPAEGLECRDVTAQHGSQVLPGNEAAPHHAAVAEHQGEQPDNTLRAWLVGERHPEESEICLGLPPGRRLEATLEKGRVRCRPHTAQKLGDGGVATGEAELTDLAPEPVPGQVREARHALPQDGFEGPDQ
jgi:hypothetical protein